MLRLIVKGVSAFPFAGKMAVRPVIHGFLRAAPGKAKTIWLGIAAVLLKAMIFGHGRQAQMGIQAFRRSIGRARYFWPSVFVTYAAVNIAVTFVQFYLLIWVWYIWFKKRRTPLLGKHEDYTTGEVCLMIFVTLGGQLLFSYGYTIYMQ